ncbi:MAG: GTPase HflX, partial [Spirochaetaceae bacterium]|nr:GTPase HflX [Spirochaetaceae bacterium]
KRLIRRKIQRLEARIEEVRKHRALYRQQRQRQGIPVVALVGYTNSGKSSLLNALSQAGVLAEHKLFATLDPTTRRIEQPGGREFLMTDTVGFIRKLPHDLIDAFRSTLEEAVLADIILHVADAGSPELDAHVEVTENVLKELGAGDKTRILILNKADILTREEREALSFRHPEGLLISARSGEGLDILLEHLGKALDASRPVVTLKLPPDRWDLRARLHKESTVLDEQYDDDGLRLTVRLSSEERGRLSEFVVDV